MSEPKLSHFSDGSNPVKGTKSPNFLSFLSKIKASTMMVRPILGSLVAEKPRGKNMAKLKQLKAMRCSEHASIRVRQSNHSWQSAGQTSVVDRLLPAAERRQR